MTPELIVVPTKEGYTAKERTDYIRREKGSKANVTHLDRVVANCSTTYTFARSGDLEVDAQRMIDKLSFGKRFEVRELVLSTRPIPVELGMEPRREMHERLLKAERLLVAKWFKDFPAMGEGHDDRWHPHRHLELVRAARGNSQGAIGRDLNISDETLNHIQRNVEEWTQGLFVASYGVGRATEHVLAQADWKLLGSYIATDRLTVHGGTLTKPTSLTLDGEHASVKNILKLEPNWYAKWAEAVMNLKHIDPSKILSSIHAEESSLSQALRITGLDKKAPTPAPAEPIILSPAAASARTRDEQEALAALRTQKAKAVTVKATETKAETAEVIQEPAPQQQAPTQEEPVEVKKPIQVKPVQRTKTIMQTPIQDDRVMISNGDVIIKVTNAQDRLRLTQIVTQTGVVFHGERGAAALFKAEKAVALEAATKGQSAPTFGDEELDTITANNQAETARIRAEIKDALASKEDPQTWDPERQVIYKMMCEEEMGADIPGAQVSLEAKVAAWPCDVSPTEDEPFLLHAIGAEVPCLGELCKWLCAHEKEEVKKQFPGGAMTPSTKTHGETPQMGASDTGKLLEAVMQAVDKASPVAFKKARAKALTKTLTKTQTYHR